VGHVNENDDKEPLSAVGAYNSQFVLAKNA